VTAYAEVNADGTVRSSGSMEIAAADVRKPPATVGIYCLTLPVRAVNVAATVKSSTVFIRHDRIAQAMVAFSGGFPGGCEFGEEALVTPFDVSDGALVDSDFNAVFSAERPGRCWGGYVWYSALIVT
jgi:hypothetical protein